MGIKTLLNKKNCFKCGTIMPVFAWKYCEQCDPRRRKKPRLQSSLISSRVFDQFTFRCDKSKAIESDTLVYDENMHIIGYRSPRFKLKV